MSLRQMLTNEPLGHGLSIGVIGISIKLILKGFHLLSPDIRGHRQNLLGHSHELGRRGDLDGV
nr:hypothetical protein [Geothrix oryzae]